MNTKMIDVSFPHKTFFWKDKIRGEHGQCEGLTNDDPDEVNFHGVTLFEWAEEAEIGDEWENSTDKCIRIS